MLKNYLLIAIRSFAKNRTYSFINISGLSIGITCSILILLWVVDELSFNKFHSKFDRLYQVYQNSTIDGSIHTWSAIPLPFGEELKPESEHIVNVAMADWGGDHLLAVGDKMMNKRVHYTSQQFLSMFSFPLLKGDPTTALKDPGSIVITQATATALFGDEDPINQIVRVNNQNDQKVTGVVANPPSNSFFQFDALLPWSLYTSVPWVKDNLHNWSNNSWQAFVELDQKESLPQVGDAIDDILQRHGEDEKKMKKIVFLHPMAKWRLYSDFEEGKATGGRIQYVQLFALIAVFILAIACINFMNLATARSEKRAREVGIRKSVGSRRHELIVQFMGESMLMATLACGIAILLSELLLPPFNQLVQKQLAIHYDQLEFWIFALGLILLTGVVSGSYPAFYLSSFQPIRVLKGTVSVGKSASTPRKVLVTLQFGFSILLIIGTIVVYQQIQYVKKRDLGYRQDNLVMTDMNPDIRKNYKVIKEALLQSGVVESVTKSNSAITGRSSWNFLEWPGKDPDKKVLFLTVAAEYDYTKTMGIKLLEGRDFSEDFGRDSASILINTAALDLMGLKDPLGTMVDLWGPRREIIGVVENTVMGSINEKVEPMFIVFSPEWNTVVTMRLNATDDISGSIKKIESVFKTYASAYPFDYRFADQEFQKKFTDLDTTSTLARLFASLAIVITGLGLFGLAAFTAAQRTKEIGIRKVLGASISSLLALLSRDFSRLVIFSFVITSPIAWWLMSRYLERYSYRVDIVWWIFPLTGMIALVFALAVVSSQALRAAKANPASTLRTE